MIEALIAFAFLNPCYKGKTFEVFTYEKRWITRVISYYDPSDNSVHLNKTYLDNECNVLESLTYMNIIKDNNQICPNLSSEQIHYIAKAKAAEALVCCQQIKRNK